MHRWSTQCRTRLMKLIDHRLYPYVTESILAELHCMQCMKVFSILAGEDMIAVHCLFDGCLLVRVLYTLWLVVGADANNPTAAAAAPSGVC